MPHPLDAERSAAGPPPRPGPAPADAPVPRPTPAPPIRPAPAPAAGAEARPADDRGDELPELAEGGSAAGPGAVEVGVLLRRAQDGHAEAGVELYDHYVTIVHRYVCHRVGDRPTDEAVTSET